MLDRRGRRLEARRHGPRGRGEGADRDPLLGGRRPRLGHPGRRRADPFPSGDVHRPLEIGGLWSGKDKPPGFSDCVDVDLGFTPATNTLPIRRLRLAVGGKREIAVAWLRWPELRLERALQRYERLAEDRYRYSSNGFSAELVVDEHGLVVDYEGLWRAIARA